MRSSLASPLTRQLWATLAHILQANHFAASHPGEQGTEHPFTFKILGASGINGNLQRYLWEALRIREAKETGEQLLNSKGEWARITLKRLVVADE